MNILLTALSCVAFLGCLFAYTRTERINDRVDEAETRVNLTAMKLRQERDRVTVLEREVDALRRELRKLGGKFYASQREEPDGGKFASPLEAAHLQVASSPFCENYEIAQREGPNSKAAQCDCTYCRGRRAAKEAFRESRARAGHLNPSWVKAHAGAVTDRGE